MMDGATNQNFTFDVGNNGTAGEGTESPRYYILWVIRYIYPAQQSENHAGITVTTTPNTDAFNNADWKDASSAQEYDISKLIFFILLGAAGVLAICVLIMTGLLLRLKFGNVLKQRLRRQFNSNVFPRSIINRRQSALIDEPVRNAISNTYMLDLSGNNKVERKHDGLVKIDYPRGSRQNPNQVDYVEVQFMNNEIANPNRNASTARN